jgi:hypothetical protein
MAAIGSSVMRMSATVDAGHRPSDADAVLRQGQQLVAADGRHRHASVAPTA